MLVATPSRALAATLDLAQADEIELGSEISPLWTWLYFLSPAPASQIGTDGHPKRGGFLPPIELPRRMWAGSRCAFKGAIFIGDKLTRTSTITKLSEKSGRSGQMVFVTVTHETARDGVVLIEEEQDIVYMPIPELFSPPAPTLLASCDWTQTAPIDPVLLFRFSALTFNGHRIHYDRPYAMDVEKYPGLVVHGPLQAIMLFGAAQQRAPNNRPATFQFRGVRPLFDFDIVTLNGRSNETAGIDLFTANADQEIGMQATISWAED
jgi:3-methylfumaryl-CoA hydratase